MVNFYKKYSYGTVFIKTKATKGIFWLLDKRIVWVYNDNSKTYVL